MTETTTPAAPARNERAKTRLGRPFGKGNPGRPKGNRNRSTRVGIEVCNAMSGQAAETLRALLKSRSSRIRLEACRTILGYSWGLPKATLEVAGGFSDLSRELAEALRQARERRLAAEATPTLPGLVLAREVLGEARAKSGAEVTATGEEKSTAVRTARSTAVETAGTEPEP